MMTNMVQEQRSELGAASKSPKHSFCKNLNLLEDGGLVVVVVVVVVVAVEFLAF